MCEYQDSVTIPTQGVGRYQNRYTDQDIRNNQQYAKQLLRSSIAEPWESLPRPDALLTHARRLVGARRVVSTVRQMPQMQHAARLSIILRTGSPAQADRIEVDNYRSDGVPPHGIFRPCVRLVREVGRFRELFAYRRVRFSMFWEKVAFGLSETTLWGEK